MPGPALAVCARDGGNTHQSSHSSKGLFEYLGTKHRQLEKEMGGM